MTQLIKIWRSTLNSPQSLRRSISGHIRSAAILFVLSLFISTASAQESPTYLRCTANNGSFDGSHGGGKERQFKVTTAPKKIYFWKGTTRGSGVWIDANEDANSYVLIRDSTLLVSDRVMVNGRAFKSSNTQIMRDSGEFFVFYEVPESMDQTRFLHGQCASSRTPPPGASL